MAFLLLLPAQAQTATPSQPGKRIALLIGNAAYKGDPNASTLNWNRLQNAAKDAQDVGNELKRLGFHPEDVTVLQIKALRRLRETELNPDTELPVLLIDLYGAKVTDAQNAATLWVEPRLHKTRHAAARAKLKKVYRDLPNSKDGEPSQEEPA